MSRYVVDASVAVKWLVAESFSEEAAMLLEKELTLIAPELLFAEVTNALWAMRRRGDISDEDLAEAIGVLKAAPISVPVSMRQLSASAVRLAVELDHPSYDCFYLTLAVQERCAVVTADQRFHDVVRKRPELTDRIVHVKNLRLN